MTSYGQSGARVPGSRREKMRGYLKAANELRQIYQEQLSQKMQGSETDGSMPGDFPDVDIVRSGNEEMLLFPSYATRHRKRNANPTDASRYPPGTNESIESPNSSGDAEYWKREWEKYEDANAVVDVDVRGWIYSPQSGPLNRKNRLLLAVARRLSGVYAPLPDQTPSRASSQALPGQGGREDSPSRYEDEIAAREAESIARHGEMEADAAQRGSYSQASGNAEHSQGSRNGSLTQHNNLSTGNSSHQDPGQDSLKKRDSWNEPANMNREELSAANQLLLSRLKPFMTTPVANIPITVFFFNDQKSASKSVTTDESGHFNLRAALDFVPAQVRVLASDKLSATEDVIVTESKGISLISDIDDTIKHSAIASGAREIFKNTFIRELSDLTIKGVKEWYAKMASMGVKLHYVSNSPWQLYPLLRSYFALAGLPAGSIHLKQYSGMLQGIFEPAAERKRGTINRLMNDFPDRKFILVGDSGEADLEVYTDVVLEYPKRVLGVFIRDVTTPPKKGFFDQAISNATPDSMASSDDGSRLPRSNQQSDAEDRPTLPTRLKPGHKAHSMPPREEDLIDFGDEPESKSTKTKQSHSDDLKLLNEKPAAPAKPNKPSSLRNFSTTSMQSTNHDRLSASDTEVHETGKKRPPPPPKPRRGGGSTRSESSNLAPPQRAPFSSLRQNQSSSHVTSSVKAPAPMPPISRTNTSASTVSSQSSVHDEGYIASARRQISSAYNALPPIRSTSPSRPADQTGISSDNRPNPPLPPRRGLSSYPAAAARWATGATGGDPAAGGDGGMVGATYDKKLEIWKRRWARAEEIMHQRGVFLRTWRVGSDVMDDCVRLVKKELEKSERR
ncbi:hypothetical protein RBB50_009986 [Rhinocladiella similis]